MAIKNIICNNPNCKYEGEPVVKAKGSMIVGIALLIVGIVPGILYFAFFYGQDHSCPKCGLKLPLA